MNVVTGMVRTKVVVGMKMVIGMKVVLVRALPHTSTSSIILYTCRGKNKIKAVFILAVKTKSVSAPKPAPQFICNTHH